MTRRSAADKEAPSAMAFLSRAFPKHNLLACELAISRELTSRSSHLLRAHNLEAGDAGSVVHLELKCEAIGADGSRQTLRCAWPPEPGSGGLNQASTEPELIAHLT